MPPYASRPELSRGRLHPEPEEVGPIVREAMLPLAPAAADAGVEVRLDVPAREGVAFPLVKKLLGLNMLRPEIGKEPMTAGAVGRSIW